MSTNLTIAAPDFAQIRAGDFRAIHDAINLLWLVANDDATKRRRQQLIWRDVGYDSSAFSASAGTWTVQAADQSQYRYILVGTCLFLSFAFIDTSTSAGMGTELYVRLPLGLSAALPYQVGTVGIYGAATAVGTVLTRAAPNAATLALTRADGSAWPSSATNTLDIVGAIALTVGAV